MAKQLLCSTRLGINVVPSKPLKYLMLWYPQVHDSTCVVGLEANVNVYINPYLDILGSKSHSMCEVLKENRK